VVSVRSPTTIAFLKVQRVALWQVTTTAGYQELSGTATGVTVPPGTAVVRVTPVDAFGRAAPTAVCDTSKVGACPTG
jgi:hypothetical protein